MGFVSFETAKHLYPPPFSCTVQTSRLWPWLPAGLWRVQSLQPFFDTDHPRKGAATRIGIQKKGGGSGSDHGSLHAKVGDFKNNPNFCWNVPMVSVDPGTSTTRNGGGVQKQQIWVRKKKRTKYGSFYFQVYAIYIETQNCSLLSPICQLVLVMTLPNCARVLGGFVSRLSKSVLPSKYVYFAFWDKRDVESPKIRTETIIVLVPILWVLNR